MMSRWVGNIFIIISAVYSSNVFSNENIYKGVKSISGTISYDQNKNKTYSVTNRTLTISSKFLYFINNNIGLGGLLAYSQNKDDTIKFITYTIGPIIRYYFQSDKILPYVGLSYGYSKFIVSGQNVVGNHVVSNQAGAAAGLDYFVAPNVAIETELKYSYTKQKFEYDPAFSLSAQANNNSIVDYNLGVGVNVFFK